MSEKLPRKNSSLQNIDIHYEPSDALISISACTEVLGKLYKIKVSYRMS